MRRTYFGSTYALGGISATRQSDLLARTEDLYRLLDQIVASANTAASLDLDATLIASALEERDALRAAADRLQDRVALLDTVDDVAAWGAELDSLIAQAQGLQAQFRDALNQTKTSTAWKMGVWTAGVVLAGVGTILLVRRYGKRGGR